MDDSEKMYVPPYTNRGVQSTQKNEKNPDQKSLRALVDWVQATVFGKTHVQIIEEFFKIKKDAFRDLKKGMYGYEHTVRFGHITICYNDIETPQGTHIVITGQGCREFETYSGRPWAEFFKDILEHGHLTRLDVAVDDFKGFYTVKKLKRKVEKGELVSKFKKARSQESIKIADGEDAGDTLYFGSPSSAIQIRFYDKKKEREAKGETVNVGFWNRAEIQARDDRATKIAEFIVGMNPANNEENTTIGTIVKGILSYYLRFVDTPKSNTTKKGAADSNKSRWKTSNFWEKYLGGVEKLKLTNKAPDRTIESIHRWLSTQTSRGLATIFEAHGRDWSVIEALIEQGQDRMDDYDKQMAEEFYIEEKDANTSAQWQNRLDKVKKMFYELPLEEREKYGSYWRLYDYLHGNN